MTSLSSRADCSLQAAHVVGTVLAPDAGLEGLGPALHALEVHVAVEEAARERDGVVARLQPGEGSTVPFRISTYVWAF